MRCGSSFTKAKAYADPHMFPTVSPPQVTRAMNPVGRSKRKRVSDERQLTIAEWPLSSEYWSTYPEISVTRLRGSLCTKYLMTSPEGMGAPLGFKKSSARECGWLSGGLRGVCHYEGRICAEGRGWKARLIKEQHCLGADERLLHGPSLEERRGRDWKEMVGVGRVRPCGLME